MIDNPVVIMSYYDRIWWALNLYDSLSDYVPVIVADDGSMVPIHSFTRIKNPRHYVRLGDKGFRKTRALNEAIYLADNLGYDYAIFLDQDAIVPDVPDWLERHKRSLPNEYIASFAHRLSEKETVDYEHNGILPQWNAPLSRDFAGCGSSCYIKDALAVGGFDESFGYVGEDINFGVRLQRHGIKPMVDPKINVYTRYHERPWAVSEEERKAALLKARL